MSWIKNLFIVCVVLLITVLAIDTFSYIFFKNKVQTVFPSYGRENLFRFGRGYPRWYFMNDTEIGFDIVPNIETTIWEHPVEYGLYNVWGNNFGCFDDEWDSNNLINGIYLAGDSHTWGYARYEKKFGTILENELQKKIYACGVAHTGQQHQFIKFKRLYDRGVRPNLVIVNIAENDVGNDFHFPHTEIIDGYMVDNSKWCIAEGNENKTKLDIKAYKYSREELKERYEDYRQDLKSVKDLNLKNLKITLKKHSFTLNVLNTFRLKVFTVGKCKDSVYGLNQFITPSNYYTSEISKSNREVIADWITHSQKNNYSLIFSLIPDKESVKERSGEGIYFKGLEIFIKRLGGEVWRFNDYLNELSIAEALKLYFSKDVHLNDDGNRAYADFLRQSIKQIFE